MQLQHNRETKNSHKKNTKIKKTDGIKYGTYSHWRATKNRVAQ